MRVGWRVYWNLFICKGPVIGLRACICVTEILIVLVVTSEKRYLLTQCPVIAETINYYPFINAAIINRFLQIVLLISAGLWKCRNFYFCEYIAKLMKYIFYKCSSKYVFIFDIFKIEIRFDFFLSGASFAYISFILPNQRRIHLDFWVGIFSYWSNDVIINVSFWYFGFLVVVCAQQDVRVACRTFKRYLGGQQLSLCRMSVMWFRNRYPYVGWG